MCLDITTIEQIEEIVSLRLVLKLFVKYFNFFTVIHYLFHFLKEIFLQEENSVSDAVDKSHKAVERNSIPKLMSAKLNKSYPKKNSSDSERTFVKNKNISNSKFYKNDNCLIKTKNTPFKQKCNNKQQISSKNTRCPKFTTRVNSNESKTKPNQTRTSNLSKIDNKMYESKINNVINITPKKALIPEPDIDKNENSYVDSNKGADETLVYNNTTNQLLETNKSYEHLSEDQIKKHSFPTDNSKGKLNIQLRIKLEDFPNVTSENVPYVKNDGSYVTLIKKEMASQVNIDVILGKEIFTLNNNVFLNRKSIESNITKTEDQDIFVQCTCDNSMSKFDVLNGSRHKNVPNVLSNATNDILLER